VTTPARPRGSPPAQAHRRRPGRAPVGLLVAGTLSCAAAAIPLVYLVVRTGSAGWDAIRSALGGARVLELAGNSLLLASAVTAGCLLLGVPTAWLLARARLPRRSVWLVLAALPLAVPSYVAAFGWVSTAGVSGFWGAFLVLTTVSAPYVTLPLLAAMRSADDLESTARTLGRAPFAAFWSVTWPQVAPSAAAGALLVALYVLSDFGAVAMVRYDALTWAVHSAYGASFDRTRAAVYALVLVLLAGSVVLAERSARRRAVRRLPATSAPGRTLPVRLGPWLPVALAGLAGVAVVSVGVPVAALVLRLANSAQAGVDWGDLLPAIGGTVALAGAGALVATAMALPIGVMAARYRTGATAALESASYLGHALPGVVVGLSLVFFTLAVVPALYQSAVVLAFAYGVLFLTKAVGAIRTATSAVPPALEDVGRTLGATASGVWARVTAPLAWPGVAAGALLVALTAMKELPATLLLRPTGVETLATELWTRTAVGAYGAAAPFATVLVLVAAVPAFLLSGALSPGRSAVGDDVS
jgi:iron(III) transport system permease protein